MHCTLVLTIANELPDLVDWYFMTTNRLDTLCQVLVHPCHVNSMELLLAYRVPRVMAT